jgi:hypothetical protein
MHYVFVITDAKVQIKNVTTCFMALNMQKAGERLFFARLYHAVVVGHAS